MSSVATMAFLYLAIAASCGALAFLAGQRSSGRTPREVDECHEQATILQGVARDLDQLTEDVERADAPTEAREDLARARMQLDDAISGLRRGADLVV